jgi:RimJ/RimL family protein N-acetyltransferase
MPAIPRLDEPLGDGDVALRPFAERDIPEILIAYQDDAHMHERLGEERPPSGAELGRRAERAEADRLAGSGVILTIVEGLSDECRGQITATGIDWEHSRGELREWVAPAARGRGLGRRGLALAAAWLLNECGLKRVQILVEPHNEPMLRAARGAGFLDEGVLRGYNREGSSRTDVVVLSTLANEETP